MCCHDAIARLQAISNNNVLAVKGRNLDGAAGKLALLHNKHISAVVKGRLRQSVGFGIKPVGNNDFDEGAGTQLHRCAGRINQCNEFNTATTGGDLGGNPIDLSGIFIAAQANNPDNLDGTPDQRIGVCRYAAILCVRQRQAHLHGLVII